MRKFGCQRKRNLVIFLSMQPEHIATHTAALSASFSSSFHWRTFFCQNLSRSSLNMFVRHIKYSAFKTISAGRHTRQYQFWIKCGTSARSESTEMRRMNRALSLFNTLRFHCVYFHVVFLTKRYVQVSASQAKDFCVSCLWSYLHHKAPFKVIPLK